jgi:hypothetical protein
MIFDKIYKAITILLLMIVIGMIYLFLQDYKKSLDNGRYQPIGSDGDLILDTRTGKIIDTEY